jgi:type III secretory pathway component EscU
MRLSLYTHGYPSGRCLLLAQELNRSTVISASDSIHLAQRLFDNQFDETTPIVIEAIDSTAAERIVQICQEKGITVVRATQP